MKNSINVKHFCYRHSEYSLCKFLGMRETGLRYGSAGRGSVAYPLWSYPRANYRPTAPEY